MIFATVGTQLPFPRFVAALDGIAARHRLEIFAQTNEPTASYPNLRTRANLGPAELEAAAAEADLIAGHAGIGTVLLAKRLRRPLILFPRRASLGEHRNEHQLATVAHLKQMTGIHVAEDEAALEALLCTSFLEPATPEASPSRELLIERLRTFIQG